MDSSRRAVESYWRSRMIDGVTSDEDKVAPVYKLEEVCELLRSSHVSIVKEVSEFILKKLDHKSPLVKQKALRLLKYSVEKSGVEFKREIQRNSAAIRQLFHYKGQLDPLKGDALNKAVRDSAHEAMTAIFASEDNKPTPPEDINKRIQGFGNTNLEMPTEDKKSFLSDMMGLGSASIRQGLSTIASAHSLKKSDNGSYKGPHLRRSLTKESERPELYEREDHSRESWISPVVSKDVSGGVWGQNSMPSTKDERNSEYGHIRTGAKGREERLLETIVMSGGVRLQPTREALQVFLTEASKVDAVALSHVLELKLQSHLWQVRMKAVCVLEAILRKKDDAHCFIIASYFRENPEFVHNCTETPQASLREKAIKVLSLLVGEQTSNAAKASNAKTETASAIEIPDLIDTGDLDEYGREDPIGKQIDPNVPNEVTPVAPVIDDLFGDKFVTNIIEDEKDTFADVSFLSSEERQQNTDDLFSGLTIDYNKQAAEGNVTTPTNSSNNRPDLFDIFGGTIAKQAPQESSTIPKTDVNDLMGGLSFHASSVPDGTQQDSGQAFSKAALSHLGNQFSHPTSNEDFIGVIGSQSETLNSSVPNPLFPLGALQYGAPQNFMLNPAYASQQINYNAMRSFFAQQQLLAMSNFQNMGNISSLGNAELGPSPYKSMEGAHALPVPDIFHLTNNPVQNPSIASNTRKEETKAFDFISDHLSSARDSRRVI